MPSQHYYLRSLSGENDDRSDNTHYLVVNCTGIAELSKQVDSGNPTGRQDFYLQYMCEGVFDLQYGEGGKCRFEKGQFIIYKPETPYRYRMASPGNIMYYWVHFTGTGAQALVSGCGLETGRVYTVGSCEGAVSAFQRLFSEFLLRDSCFDMTVMSLLITVISSLARQVRGQSGQTCLSERLLTSLRYIHKNYASDISVSSLAAMEHLTVNYYRTLFEKCTGHTPLEYLLLVRTGRARELLAGTSLPVYIIAENVGFADGTYFSRVFKKATGVSPTEYRKSFLPPVKKE